MRIAEEEKKKRRDAMIYQAFSLFYEKGIESVKMAEIAEKSQMGQATVYRYFKNKEQLVLEVFLKLWDEIMFGVYNNVEMTPDYEKLTGYEQLEIWIEGFSELYHHEDFILFFYEAKLYFLRHNMKLDKDQQNILLKVFYEPCVAALEKGKRDGSIPIKENSDDIFYAIWGTIRGYVIKIVIYGKLDEDGSPWESRYRVIKKGILSALSCGWEPLSENGKLHGKQR